MMLMMNFQKRILHFKIYQKITDLDHVKYMIT